MRKVLWSAGLGFFTIAALFAFQRPFREYPGLEYNNFPRPADYQEKTEWAFARLMYPQGRGSGFGFRRGGGDWREGYSMWTQDYPRADRHFSAALRRLTRIHVRSVEQPVNLDDGDDVFNWPFLVAGEMGDWKLTRPQADKLRDYLLRGGFLLMDDFWGPDEWARFEETMRVVFPDRPIVEIDDSDSIFHTVYDLENRYQIFGQWTLRGMMRWRSDGTVPHW